MPWAACWKRAACPSGAAPLAEEEGGGGEGVGQGGEGVGALGGQVAEGEAVARQGRLDHRTQGAVGAAGGGDEQGGGLGLGRRGGAEADGVLVQHALQLFHQGTGHAFLLQGEEGRDLQVALAQGGTLAEPHGQGEGGGFPDDCPLLQARLPRLPRGAERLRHQGQQAARAGIYYKVQGGVHSV